jgi:hypothetical protein
VKKEVVLSFVMVTLMLTSIPYALNSPSFAMDSNPSVSQNGNTMFDVTFIEDGLSTGSLWYLNISRVSISGSLYSQTYSVELSNGTYYYQAYSAQYKQSVNGSFTVEGHNENIAIHFGPSTYNLIFFESGLPRGKEWGVNLNGSSNYSNTSTIFLIERNGTYSFSVVNISGFISSPSSGSVEINGYNVTVNITFKEEFTVTFHEKGLPSGFYWYVNISRISYSAGISGDFYYYHLPNGSYIFTISSSDPNMIPSPRNGSFKVSGNDVEINVTFSPVNVKEYSITFFESGLPTDEIWAVTVNGTTLYSSSQFILFSEPNGSYFYSVSSPQGYIASPESGSLVVDGSSVNVSVIFSAITYNVNFIESGLAAGTPWSVELNGTTEYSSTNTITFNEPNGSYSYIIGIYEGYSASPYSGTVTVNGASVSVSITFTQVKYSVTFTESGLPSGATWNVTLNGVTHFSYSNSIIFNEPNGTYSYSIGSINGFTVSSSSGSVVVNGANVNIAVTFTPKTYKITFIESGLPTGTSWSVTLNGTTSSSTNNTITFSVPNGTYSYTIETSISGYRGSPASGSITINGASVSTDITFTQVKYTVTFTETGLSSGNWYVNITGQPSSGPIHSTSYSTSLPNGSYTYSVSAGNKQYKSSYSGSFTVNGASVSQSITFTLVTYSITFTESGLQSGTSWSVALNGTTESSTNDTIIFNEPNGTYTYTIHGISGYKTNAYSGAILVSGKPMSENVVWKIVTYPIAVTQSGIPSGTSWSVTLTGTTFNDQKINVTLSSTNNTIIFNEPNGTYSYTLHLPSGYTTTNKEGNITVSDHSLALSMNAKQSSRPTSQPLNYSIIIIVVLLAAAIVALLALLRKRK